MSELTALATDVTFSRHATVPPIRCRAADTLPRERSIYYDAVIIPQEGPTCKLGLGVCRNATPKVWQLILSHAEVN